MLTHLIILSFLALTKYSVESIGSREGSPDWFRELQSQNFNWGNIVDLPSSPKQSDAHYHAIREQDMLTQSSHLDSGQQKDDGTSVDMQQHGVEGERVNKDDSRELKLKQENNRRYYHKVRSDPQRSQLAKAYDKDRRLQSKIKMQERLDSLPQTEREAEIAKHKLKRAKENKTYYEKHSEVLKAKGKARRSNKADKSNKTFKLSETEREIGKRKMQLFRARKKEREQQQNLAQQQILAQKKNPWLHP